MEEKKEDNNNNKQAQILEQKIKIATENGDFEELKKIQEEQDRFIAE